LRRPALLTLTCLVRSDTVAAMKRSSARVVFPLICLMAFPWIVPAPLVYRAGEGWSYEPVGGGKWQRARAKDQFELAQKAFDQ